MSRNILAAFKGLNQLCAQTLRRARTCARHRQMAAELVQEDQRLDRQCLLDFAEGRPLNRIGFGGPLGLFFRVSSSACKPRQMVLAITAMRALLQLLAEFCERRPTEICCSVPLPDNPPIGLHAILRINNQVAFNFDLSKHYNVVFQNICREVKPNVSVVDLNKLNRIFDLLPSKYVIFDHAQTMPKIEENIQAEISRERARIGKNGLNGLNDLYCLPTEPGCNVNILTENRVDPCGMGYFGKSNGLTDGEV